MKCSSATDKIQSIFDFLKSFLRLTQAIVAGISSLPFISLFTIDHLQKDSSNVSALMINRAKKLEIVRVV